MNNSELHRKLVKLYLMYFESASVFEDTKGTAPYYRTVRFLKHIERTARARRDEVRKTYKSTQQYKKLTSENGQITKKVRILRSKYGPSDDNKK